MKKFAILTILIITPLALLSAGSDPYGNTSPADYVMGRFNPAQHSRFMVLDHTGLASRKGMYLRKETYHALKRMIHEFHKSHPGVPVTVISATRNFYAQKYIWEGKWTGRRKVHGKRLNRTEKNPLNRGKVILRYSSMPGTSRHHWGTDVDLNSLNNSYFQHGKGKILYHWLRKNAHRFGFCQPYSAGRSRGYYEERWHWSYIPLAKKFHHTWNRLNKKGKLAPGSSFKGAGVVWHLAPVYVNAIRSSCM
jgi:zinc D-Ala-D-Ala carboxypeptidase